MLALLKKDFRVFRAVTFGGIALITLVHLISFVYAPMFGTIITVLLASAYGGSCFAAERREHSSDWLNMLPVTRRRIVTSKVVVSFACLTALWFYTVLPTMVIHIHDLRNVRVEDFAMFGSVMGACGILFGFAWLLSTFLESSAIAACIAIAFVITVIFGTAGINLILRIGGNAVMVGMIVFLALASIASFVFGTRYYLNRVEP